MRQAIRIHLACHAATHAAASVVTTATAQAMPMTAPSPGQACAIAEQPAEQRRDRVGCSIRQAASAATRPPRVSSGNEAGTANAGVPMEPSNLC